jgi:hypothetical protein
VGFVQLYLLFVINAQTPPYAQNAKQTTTYTHPPAKPNANSAPHIAKHAHLHPPTAHHVTHHTIVYFHQIHVYVLSVM